MRLIGELSDLNEAKKFAAYLVTEKITPQVEAENGGFEIWVKEEDEFKRAMAELEKFKANPNDEKYRGVLEKASAIAKEEEKKRREMQKHMVDVARQNRTVGAAPLTTMLIFLCCIVALMTSFGEANMGESPALHALAFTSVQPEEARELLKAYEWNAEAPAVRLYSVYKGEVWRLVTPIFIHFGALHIIFNMLWLFQFGKMIEMRYGIFWMAMLVLATAIISNLFQCLVPQAMGGSTPILPQGHLIMPLGGMSGVVYGLFGFICVKQFYDPLSGLALPQSTIVLLAAWLFIGGFFIPGIAHWAHGVGLAVGMAAAFLPMMFGGSSIRRRTS